jgi:glutamate synthase (NADPH/NADH) small chain
VLGIVSEPVAIRHIEQTIADRGFSEGWVVPRPPRNASGSRVAVVGSGPAGLAAAQQLRRSGHEVVVFDKSGRVGGLLRYGIPEFKLQKAVLDLRLDQLRAEGVQFRTGIDVGVDVTAQQLRAGFDAICIATGAGVARDLQVPGRELGGIHLAMDFLIDQNRRLERTTSLDEIEPARDRRVVIIGGGDTGSDCAGTCIRQGARSVRQFELLPQPPATRSSTTPWPLWPMQLRTSHAHEEGAERDWSIATTGFSGENGRVKRIHAVRVETKVTDGRTELVQLPGSELEIEAEMVLLAMGFTGVVRDRLLTDLGVAIDSRGNVASQGAHATSVPGVFVAGDARRGASLIVWAIREGRDAAESINAWLGARTQPAA